MRFWIQNARLVGESGEIGAPVDLSIRRGRVERILPAGSCPAGAEALDAAGSLLLPGLVDFHTHLFPHGSTFGFEANRLLSSGVVAAVDMGSAGWMNYAALHDCDLAGRVPLLKSYLHVSPVGQPGKGVAEPLTDAVILVDKMREMMRRYPGEIVGVKLRLSKEIVGELGAAPLDKALAVAEELDLPLCVHTTNPPATPAEIIEKLRPGDIYCHTYQGAGHTVLDAEGKLLPEMPAAQKRGVLIEVGNGTKNFHFPTALGATAQGLWPDIISSDASAASYHASPAMWDLTMVASKFLAMGMPLGQVIKAITKTPAELLGIADAFGSIAEGREANLTLCRMDETPTEFRDSFGGSVTGPRGLVPLATIRCGEIVWQQETPSE